MNYKNIAWLAFILLFCSIQNIDIASAQENTYTDSFNNFDLSHWTVVYDTWGVENGTLVGFGVIPRLIFKQWEGSDYIFKVDVSTKDTRIKNFATVKFYFYYKDESNYGRVEIVDDNRPDGENDAIRLYMQGPTFFNTKNYIKISGNTSIEFNPREMYQLQVVRLNKKIYVFFDNRLALTTEFKDENPEGNVGFDVYQSTGYFDNFSLRPISMNNASGYIDKLNLTSTNPTARLGHYTLRFEGIQSGGDARFSLSKYGKKVDTTLAQAGSMVSLNYENGDTGVEFKLVDAMDDGKGGIVQLEEVISASSESTSVGIDNITLLPEYHQDEKMNIGFSIANPGEIDFSGMPSVTIESGGRRETLNPDLELGAGESQDFKAVLKVPETPGVHTLTIKLELDDETTVTKSVDYNVTMLNPLLTILSSDLRDDNGIRGTVTFNSAYPDKFVDWDTNMTVEIFRIVENGREGVFIKKFPVVKSGNIDVNIPYQDFYQYDGRYLVSITLGNMKNERLFEVKGPDGIYDPTDKSKILLVIDNLYTQIILLLLGMITALSIRNYRNQTSNISIDHAFTGCGIIIIIAGIVHGWINVMEIGIIVTGIGLLFYFSQELDIKVNTILSKNSSAYDFVILTIIFLSMSYLILLIPEWNPILTMGTLIGYYIIININKGSGSASVDIPSEEEAPEVDLRKYLAGEGKKTPEVPIKLIFVGLAMIILLGIAWTLYSGVKEQPLKIQPEVETPAVTRIPSVTEIPVVTETKVPEITPTGNRTFISLDRHKVLRGVSPSIKVGDEIIWVNEGLDRITVVSDNIPGFKEQVLDVGKKTTPYMFMRPGTYNYYLKGNKNVNGTIKVT